MEYLSVSVWGPQAGHAGIHGLVPGEQQRLGEIHQPHQDPGEQGAGERDAAHHGPLCPRPPLTNPSPQNGQVQGLVGRWSVEAPH